MPIEVDAPIRLLGKDEFHELAYFVMGEIFGTHNEFSRLLDETPFKTLIQRRCEQSGIESVRREVEILVTHKGFRKSYYMDLLFNGCMMVEAKVVDALSPSHIAQAIHYLLLAGMQHGLLVNLRTPRVQKHFVSTNLTPELRRKFQVDDSRWRNLDSESERLRCVVEDLVSDWGVFLGVPLYREAIAYFLGGPEKVFRRVALFDGNSQIGMHDVDQINQATIFSVTALTDGKDEMEHQLRKLLSHTRMANLHWINFDRHQVFLQTL